MLSDVVLFVVAVCCFVTYSEESVSLFQILLDGGDHLDAVSDSGKTVISVAKQI